jgi:glucokinase
MSRVQLARRLEIAPSTAGIYVERLLRENFLVESEKTSDRLGRPAKKLQLNPKGGRFIGVDFEARNIMSTAVDFSEAQLEHYHATIRARDSVEQILSKIEDAIEAVIESGSGRVLGVGVAVPGVVDAVRGRAIRYPFIRGWENIELRARLQSRFKTPVFLENNVRCMALAELWFGHGKGLRNFICIGVRSGIGAGIVLDGHLVRGSTNQAGEIGRWSCPVPTRPRDYTGRDDFHAVALEAPSGSAANGGIWSWNSHSNLEHVASLSAMLDYVQDKVARGQPTSMPADREILLPDLLDALRSGDPFACDCLRMAARVHGWVVWQLASLFNPEKIIFTSPLAELGEPFLTDVRESAAMFSSGQFGVEVTASRLGRFNGALGAAALALHEWKPKR